MNEQQKAELTALLRQFLYHRLECEADLDGEACLAAARSSSEAVIELLGRMHQAVPDGKRVHSREWLVYFMRELV